MSIDKQVMLIFTDAKNNNNKFYEVTLMKNGEVHTRWGRVGSEGTKGVTMGGEREFNRVIRAKEAKGYEKTNTLSLNVPKSVETVELAEVAKRDMLKDTGNPSDKNAVLLKNLLEKLAEMNKHQIMEASGGNIKINSDGLMSTALGVVTDETVSKARTILEKIEKFVENKKFTDDQYINLLEEYLKLIPQKVPAKRGWYETFFTNFSSLNAQGNFLDQLEGAIDLYNKKQQEALEEANKKKEPVKEMFKSKLSLVEDKAIIAEIQKFFDLHKSRNHVSSHLKLKNVYAIENELFKKTFTEKAKALGNVKTLWHGTRVFNVLSILKGGLIIPKSGGSYQITGRMFGNGVYFSDQSTKSLNYSYGYWDSGKKDDNCFMFLADVAMGKEYVPPGPMNTTCPKGYDSTFAKAQKSGVMNNEMIVYNLEQIYLKYLCEFEK